MGRASRRKRERRHSSSPSILTSVLARYERESLIGLLEAAASSPGALHRQPSVEYALSFALARRRAGDAVATAADLTPILDAAGAALPALATIEDWIPLDPRLPATVRWQGELLRMHPGAQERPIANVHRARLVAATTDDVLRARLGFGLSDLIEVSLRFTDEAVRRLAPAWDATPVAAPGADAAVSAIEIAAATVRTDVEALLARCRHPDRAKGALAWATSPAERLRFTLDDPTSSFGPTIAVAETDGTVRFLPAGLQQGGLASAVNVLAAEAARLDPRADVDFRERSADRVAALLRRADLPTIAGPTMAGIGPIHSLVQVSGRHVLAVGVAAALDQTELARQCEAMGERLEQVRPGLPFHNRDGEGRIPANVEIVRLVIVSSANHLVLTGPPGIAQLTLDDLDWIARTADETDDLYRFCRDLVLVGGTTRLFSFETMNAWEWWRANGKALHQMGKPPTAMLIAAHQTDAEWTAAAAVFAVEVALLALALPPLRDWEVVHIEDRWVRLGDREPHHLWTILLGPRPIGLRYVTAGVPRETLTLVTNVGDALLWTIVRTAMEFEHLVATALGARPLRLVFRRAAAETAPPIRLGGVNLPDTIEFGWDERLWDAEAAAPGTVQALLGEVLVEGFVALGVHAEGEGVRAYRQAWAAAPPAFAQEMAFVPQQARDLPSPWGVPAAAQAEVRRELAASLRDRGIAPGILSDEEAIRFESTVVYPALLAMLREAWADCRWDALLDMATRQLEFASAKRARQRREIEMGMRSMPLEYDPVRRSYEQEHTGSVLGRALTTIIELALTEPPSGSRTPDRFTWGRILATAELCVESGLRGEGVRYGVTPLVTEITASYKLVRREGGAPVFDAAALREAQLANNLPQPWDAGTASQVRPEADADTPDRLGVVVARPELAEIDAALRGTTGCGLDALLEVLLALQSWPVTAQSPVGVATGEEAIAFCREMCVSGEVELAAALRLLTLRGGDLRTVDLEPWEFSKRRYRLVAQLVVERPDGRLLILPWWTEQAAIVYAGYLEDGRLPWPDQALGPALKAALDRYRQQRNTALEDDVAALLKDAGFVVAKRIKKARAIGLAALAGEIDALAARPEGGILWVIEVKDPSRAIAIAEMRRAVERFHGSGEWVDKLTRKVTDVRTDPAAVGRRLGVAGTVTEVRGIMVTRRPVAAAFVPAPAVPFTTRDEVLSVLREAGQTGTIGDDLPDAECVNV